MLRCRALLSAAVAFAGVVAVARASDPFVFSTELQSTALWTGKYAGSGQRPTISTTPAFTPAQPDNQHDLDIVGSIASPDTDSYVARVLARGTGEVELCDLTLIPRSSARNTRSPLEKLCDAAEPSSWAKRISTFNYDLNHADMLMTDPFFLRITQSK